MINKTNTRTEDSNAQSRLTQVTEITYKLEAGIIDVFASGKMKEYLQTMARFHNYSFTNSMLIYIQNPLASYVAGYKSWEKMKRHVMKGEKGIKIFAPCGNGRKEKLDTDKDSQEKIKSLPTFYTSVTVFDISQTDGEPLNLPCMTGLDGSVDKYHNVYAALLALSPVPISFTKINIGAHGLYCPNNNQIIIDDGMSEIHTIKTMIHEIAHATIHTIDKLKEQKKDKNTKEVEAEAIAYTVCHYLGIDTSDYSFEYVAAWSSDRDLKELKASMNTIRETADIFIKQLEFSK